MKALRVLALLICLLACTVAPPARAEGIIREVTAKRLSQMGQERKLKTLEQLQLKVVKYTTLPIELLKEGDWVLTRDENDVGGMLALTQIAEKFERIAYHLRHLTLRSSNGHTQTIPTTNEHPAYVEELGIWVKAADVEVGQSLNELPGGNSVVTETFQERQHQGVRVYNFRLKEGHTYFVRQAGSQAEPVWVHNAGAGYSALRAKGSITENEVTTFEEFDARKVVGDELEPHELWQHANLKANGLAAERLSTAASKGNPVIALNRRIHQLLTRGQNGWDAAAITPIQNIKTNVMLARLLNAVPAAELVELERMAIGHANSLGFYK